MVTPNHQRDEKMKLPITDAQIRTAPQYATNPFMETASIQKLPTSTKQIQAPKKGTVFEAATGEQIGQCDGWYRKTEVDATQFIKLYLEGIGALKHLTKPGLSVFQTLYIQMTRQVMKDKVAMTPTIALNTNGTTKRIYFAGMAQLLQTGFIAKTEEPPFYWINPAYIFNGDRLRFVQDYDLTTTKNELQTELIAAIDMQQKKAINK